jgi:hypothetical protein
LCGLLCVKAQRKQGNKLKVCEPFNVWDVIFSQYVMTKSKVHPYILACYLLMVMIWLIPILGHLHFSSFSFIAYNSIYVLAFKSACITKTPKFYQICVVTICIISLKKLGDSWLISPLFSFNNKWLLQHFSFVVWL